MTRLWFPLLLAAVLLCLLIAYAHEERRAEAEWREGCAKIKREVNQGR